MPFDLANEHEFRLFGKPREREREKRQPDTKTKMHSCFVEIHKSKFATRAKSYGKEKEIRAEYQQRYHNFPWKSPEHEEWTNEKKNWKHR